MFRVETRGERVALLTMDDGKVNAIGPDFLAAFAPAWREATAGQRAVVLAGNAKAFSAGLNLKVLPTLERDALAEFMRGFVRLMGDLYAYSAPLVTAVDGPALAGGAIFELCGDIRLVTPTARIGLTEMPVGIPFPPAVLDFARTMLPPQEVGPAILQGAIREGAAAVEHGWAHRLVARDRLIDEAVAVATELASFNPRAYAAAKNGLRGSLARSIAEFEKGGASAYIDELMHEDTIAAIVSYFERVTRK